MIDACLSLYFYNYFLLFLRLNKIEKCFYFVNISITEELSKKHVEKINIITFFYNMFNGIESTIR